MSGAAGIYAVAIGEVLRRPVAALTVWVVLGVALCLRLSVLFAPPFLSSDVFRYVWDGMVQVAGINPYRYVPADPALAVLRDGAIYPNVNRATYAPTIYPPLAQIVFAASAWISPSVLAMKATMVVFEFAGIVAMLGVLDRARLPRARVLIYAWNPLGVWAFAGNGHVDALAVGLLGLALLARAVWRDTLTGVLLGGAILVKFLPAAIAPALWRRGDWRMPTACLAVIVALYLVYIGAGPHVFGFLPGYAAEEGIDRGAAFWLLAGIGEVATVGHGLTLAYEAGAAVVLLALAGLVTVTPKRDWSQSAAIIRTCRDAAILAGATIAALSPHYPWYFCWLALPCCVAPLRSVIYLSVASLLLYLNPLDERFLWPSLLYVPAIALAVMDMRDATRRSASCRPRPR